MTSNFITKLVKTEPIDLGLTLPDSPTIFQGVTKTLHAVYNTTNTRTCQKDVDNDVYIDNEDDENSPTTKYIDEPVPADFLKTLKEGVHADCETCFLDGAQPLVYSRLGETGKLERFCNEPWLDYGVSFYSKDKNILLLITVESIDLEDALNNPYKCIELLLTDLLEEDYVRFIDLITTGSNMIIFLDSLEGSGSNYIAVLDTDASKYLSKDTKDIRNTLVNPLNIPQDALFYCCIEARYGKWVVTSNLEKLESLKTSLKLIK